MVKSFTKRVLKKKKIGVLMGGPSAERYISIKSASSVYEALCEMGYDAVRLDIGSDLALNIKKRGIEVAFIALHGSPGEDGTVQGLLEVMGIPYTGSGVFASALCMDKIAAKEFLHCHGILTPPFRILTPGSASPGGLKLPYVVKPPTQGSAIGITVVRKKADFKAALKLAGKYGDNILAESFIDGRELTVGMLGADKLFDIVEIEPEEGFYDYEAKYTAGKTNFSVPAELSKAETRGVLGAAGASYKALRCRGSARVDIILDKQGRAYVIEVNTVPGMTKLSLLPKSALSAGMEFGALVEAMLLGATTDI